MLRVNGMIKLDSMWKWNYGRYGRTPYAQRMLGTASAKLVRGYFESPLQSARRRGDGMRGLRHYQDQPWETWRERIR